ncbi:hypothetical protein KVH22_32910 [Streptomyces olivaceus]|uniref:hypothetical protein n=1 Tax=Streptomyces TaxID=1883 RepID=UPI001CCE3790|nr:MULTISPECIES: hypothetical protein [Streptomyces]MBZ6129998.1 hypothetical protein [Streptomyces olivaceus]MBZ6141811.1 hypothetical protein [Streptomyces olivaceus]MBZ6165959.1 hypothetical protein [Streptomyces olivaceus]MBZ6171715.1 hypothetical protein [Streptomyces olivaceus]MBZ6184285.1 hypothetical protein [Streptomyces olivaceus]
MNGEWLIRGRDGRLSVYLMAQDAVLWRAEELAGGAWTAARRIGGDRRLSSVAGIGRGADGYTHLAAWSPTPSGGAELVHTTHFRPLLAPLDWAPAGHPDGKGGITGGPAVAVDDQGRGHVFARNEGGGVSKLAQKYKGGWHPWRDLKGADLQGPPAAVAGRAGRMEVYAAGSGTLQYWRQEEPATRFDLVEAVECEARPGTLRALATSDEATTLFFTDGSDRLCVWRPGTKPVPLLSAAGPGPVAATRAVIDGHDCTLVAQRSAGSGRVVFAAYPSEQEELGASWTESGPALPADALVSLARDADGRVVAATLSPSGGQLLLSRQKDEAGLALGAWQAV